MAFQRFQQRMYLRQLRTMRADINAWRRLYESDSKTTTSAQLAGQLARRAAVLEQLRDTLDDAFRQLEELPRLS